MAPRGGAAAGPKRAGSAVAKAETKRFKAAGESAEDMIESVATALDTATAVSGASREMLRRMSAGCLGTPPHERHRYQAAVALMLQDVLISAEETVGADIEEAAAEVNSIVARMSSLHETRSVTDVALQSCGAALEAAKASFRKSNVSLQDARKALDQAIEVQERTDAGIHLALATKKALEEVYRDHYLPLASDACTDPEVHVSAIACTFPLANLDESLAKAFSVAARKAPPVRSAFDNMVLKQFETDFTRCITRLGEEAQGGAKAAGVAERAVAVAEARSGLQEACERQQAAASALRAAELDQRVAEAEVWDAKESEASAVQDLRKAEAAHAAAEQDLADIRSGPLKALQALLERRPAPGERTAAEGSSAAAVRP